MSEIEKNPYTQTMTTYCAGRFLIDMPKEFAPKNPGGDKYSASGINSSEVTAQQSNRAFFDVNMEILKQNYQDDSKHPAETYLKIDKPYLKDIYSLKDGRKGMIFDRNETDASLRTLEGHLWSNGVWITLKINARDMTRPGYEDRIKLYGKDANTIQKKLKEAQELLSRMEGWDNVHIPQYKGTCFPNIYVRGAAGMFDEAATNLFYYKGETKEDHVLSITVEYDSALKDTSTLLQRTDRMKEFESMVPGGKILRKGVREIHGMHAEEILTSGPSEQKGKTDYLFTLIGNETTGSPQHPYLSVTLKANADVISEKDAVAIWDAVIPTIRPRPGAY